MAVHSLPKFLSFLNLLSGSMGLFSTKQNPIHGVNLVGLGNVGKMNRVKKIIKATANFWQMTYSPCINAALDHALLCALVLWFLNTQL